MQVELFKPSEMNADFWSAFHDLRNAFSLYDDPFFDPEFARLVGEVRNDTFIAVAFDQGKQEPVAFWPLHVRPGGWARPIGGPFSDWHGPVYRQDDPVDPCVFLSSAGLSGFTAFGMPAESSWGRLSDRSGVNMADVSNGWDNFLTEQKMLYAKHFKKIRRMQRNTERDFQSVEYRMNDDDEAAFTWLMSRKRQQFNQTGRHDVLGPQWVQELFQRLRGHQSERMSAHLATLRFDGAVVAAELNLMSDNIIHGWITAFETEFSYYSPGYLLMHEVIRNVNDVGRTFYDLGAGMEHYKKYYTNFQFPMVSGAIHADPKQRFPRVFADSWRIAENSLPDKASHMMQKMRRRADQVFMAETTLGGRISGFAKALKR